MDRGASTFQLKSLRLPQERYDVAILGGGLAGLSLANQLKLARPQTTVLVADRRPAPAPEAAFKVGESSVEIGAHYFRTAVGMADHLDERQLRKLGLRFFLPAGDNGDIARRVEFCTPPTDANVLTHHFDRGAFENELFERATKRGADAFRGWRVVDVDFDPAGEHEVTLSHEGEQRHVKARWVVDATGRYNLLRRKLGLHAETGHHVNACWFRLKGGLDLEDWSEDREWLARTREPGVRRDATAHLCGEGYWVWLIRLATGPISIGIVSDPRFHPWAQTNEFEAAFRWLQAHEPQLARHLQGRLDDVQDFLVVEDFSYGSSQVLSTDRWLLTGEAAAFVDPLYSPGSDFIAYLNTFGGELICRDLDGEEIAERLDLYERFFERLFTLTLRLYRDRYELLGDPQVMLAKLLCDNIAYLQTLAFAFLHGRISRLEDLAEVVDELDAIAPLLERMQQLFSQWHRLDGRPFEGVSALSTEMPAFVQAQRELGVELPREQLARLAREKAEVLKAIAVWTFHLAARRLPEPPDPQRPIDPLAIGLDPAQWAQDGLFVEDGERGWTLARALELVPGIEAYDLEARTGALVE